MCWCELASLEHGSAMALVTIWCATTSQHTGENPLTSWEWGDGESEVEGKRGAYRGVPAVSPIAVRSFMFVGKSLPLKPRRGIIDALRIQSVAQKALQAERPPCTGR